jgi:hypothetical protein
MHRWTYLVRSEYGHEATYANTSNIPSEMIPTIEEWYENDFGTKGTVVNFTKQD